MTTSNPVFNDLPESTQVAVVGGGQAGLSVSWYLSQSGIDHVVIEADTAVHSWSDSRWDNFTLVTPNWQCRLPGYHYDGPEPDGFMTKAEVVDWLNGWLRIFPPPVVEHTRVTALRHHHDGGFVLDCQGENWEGTLTADHVVVATGGYQIPVIPNWAKAIDPAVTQLHTSQYRNPDQLPEGAVLVVGSGQSGAQIAEDLHLAGRKVHLAVGEAPRVARSYRGRDCMTWLADMGVYDVPVAEYPGGSVAREKTNHYVTGRGGGRDIDLRRFALEGMHLYGRAVDGDGDSIEFAPTVGSALDAADAVYNSICADIDRYIDEQGLTAGTPSRYEPVWRPGEEMTRVDLAEASVTSIVWCIGYRTDYRWIHASAFDGAGRPMHTRGISEVNGLSFIGLPWMHTWGSGRFLGMERDAAHLVDAIAADLSGLARPASAHAVA